MRDAATPAVALESKEESHLKHLQGTSCSRFGCQWTLTRDRGCSTGSRQTQGLPSFCLFRCSCVLCVFLFSIPGTPSRLAILSGHPSLSPRAAGAPPGSAFNLVSRMSPCGAYAAHLLRSEYSPLALFVTMQLLIRVFIDVRPHTRVNVVIYAWCSSMYCTFSSLSMLSNKKALRFISAFF